MEDRKLFSFFIIEAVFMALAIWILPAVLGAQEGGGAFGNIFGVSQQGQVSASNSSGSSQTGAPAASGGFFSPVPIKDERTVQKDKEGRAYGILSFFLRPPGDAKVNISIDFGPWARYGLVKKAMVFDVNGNVMGGYVDQDDKDVRITGVYRLYVEKWNSKYGRWEEYADYPRHTGGRITFKEEAHYRLSVLPVEQTVFQLSPQSAVVTAKDPAMDRTGQIIYDQVLIEGMPAYLGTGILPAASPWI